MRLTPYQNYKDSGVEWLGEVPTHWEVQQLGRIGQFSKGSGGTKEDEVANGVPCIRYGDIYTEHQFFIRKSRACVLEGKASIYAPIQYGDVLFAGSGETIEEIGKSAVNLISEQIVCGGDVILFRPSIEIDASFLGYATDCPQATYQKACMGRGVTIMHIYSTELKNLYISLPPLPEQTAIVHYLGYFMRRMRRYIRAKQKLIKLLEEQKQAVIQRAVTRGLAPDVPLKPSGVEWLGDVPAHWDMRRLKNVAQLVMGQSATSDNCSLKQIGPPFLQGCAEFGEHHPKPVQFCSKPPKISPSCAILMSVRAPVGRLNIADQEYGIGRGLCAIIPNESMFSASFALYELDVVRHGFAIVSTGSTYDAVSVGDIGIQLLLLPPLQEQTAIAEYLDKFTADINAKITLARQQTDLMREYRTRLIADVVTGKLDVRKAAADGKLHAR